MDKIESRKLVYQAGDGAIELRGDDAKETIWATQEQIAGVFGVERSVVTKHVNNIFRTKEVNEKKNTQKLYTPPSDKLVVFYSLDIILAVGYRANSARAIAFRKWATKTLREHITVGYTINRKRVAKNYDSFMKAVADVRSLVPAGSRVDTGSVLELITAFASTWFSLDAYDRGEFGRGKVTKKAVSLAADDLREGVEALKAELVKKGEATDIFATERSPGSIDGIIGNVLQTFGGKELYPSVEEKAANLLYFMVKDHPFTDGNKRSGAFAFAWFLQKAALLDASQLTPSALTALTLLVAESDAREKEKVVGLVTMLLRR